MFADSCFILNANGRSLCCNPVVVHYYCNYSQSTDPIRQLENGLITGGKLNNLFSYRSVVEVK